MRRLYLAAICALAVAIPVSMRSLPPPLEARVAVLEEQIRGMDRALQIQARQYEARLESLNGERARQLEDRANFISRDVYDSSHKDLMDRVLRVEAKITSIESEHAGASGLFSATSQGIVVIVALVGLAYTLIVRKHYGSK